MTGPARRRAAGLLLATLLASSCGGGGARPAASSAPPTATATPSPTPTATPTPRVDTVARRLRLAARNTLAGCPCEFVIRVSDQQSERELTLTGVYRHPGRNSELWSAGGTVMRVVDGVTYYRGDASGGKWVRLDVRNVPARTKDRTLAMAAAVDPALMMAAATGVHTPIAKGASDDGGRYYSVTLDLRTVAKTVGRRGPLLRYLQTRPEPYASVELNGPRIEYVSLPVIAPGLTDAHGVGVRLWLYGRRPGVPAAVAPAGARPVVVR
ncbi:MAG TPA: hypothetical protein VNA20_18890 [Frankiaceae bacterium]|nr:hypothetical protein [Frankiaceae bacterium]